MKIATDKIREVIGTGGKVIREIVEKTGAKINIEDDGTIKIASSDGAKIKAAINWIKSIASDPEIGQIYDGTIVKTVDFGAFVNFFGSKDGLVHISQLAKGRVAKTTDVVKEGDKVKVKLLGFDDRGKVRLSMRVVDQQTGADLEKQAASDESAPPTNGAARANRPAARAGRGRDCRVAGLLPAGPARPSGGSEATFVRIPKTQPRDSPRSRGRGIFASSRKPWRGAAAPADFRHSSTQTPQNVRIFGMLRPPQTGPAISRDERAGATRKWRA